MAVLYSEVSQCRVVYLANDRGLLGGWGDDLVLEGVPVVGGRDVQGSLLHAVLIGGGQGPCHSILVHHVTPRLVLSLLPLLLVTGGLAVVVTAGWDAVGLYYVEWIKWRESELHGRTFQ